MCSRRINIIILLCFTFAVNVESQNMSAVMDILPDCKVVVMGIIKQHLKAFSVCMKEIKENVKDNNELASKLNCAVKCVLDKVGLLNDEHKVTKQTVQEFMDKNIPLIYHDIGHDFSSHCYDEFGPQMDHDDEYCHAYGKFVECMQHVVSEVC